MIKKEKKDILLIGGGDFAKKVIHLINSIQSYNIIGYTDIEDKGTLFSIPYLGNDKQFWTKEKPLPTKNIVICIAGNLSLVKSKQLIIESYKKLGCNFPTLISPNSFVNETSLIGNGVLLFDFAYVDFSTEIKDFSIINLKATVCHDAKIGENVLISPHTVITGGVSIGDNSIIGTNSTINPYIKINKNVVIGSNALVTKDITDSGVYTGTPAKIKKK